MGDSEERTKEKIEEEKNIQAALRIVNLVFSKRGFAGLGIVVLLFGGGATFTGNRLSTILSPPQTVEVTSPELRSMVEEELAPVKNIIQGHVELFTHPKAGEALHSIQVEQDVQAAQLYIIEDNQDEISKNLRGMSEVLNKLTGQMELIVEMEMRRIQ